VNRLGVIAAAAALLSAPGAWAAPPDPPGGTLDPPPGPQTYIKSLPQGRWTFGSMLWRGLDPCDASRCEAAFNDGRLAVLVQKERYCCGQDGYSLTVTAVVEGCSASGYYLVFSKDLDRMSPPERLALASRHVAELAGSMRSACGLKTGGDIPTDELERLWR
jgi:hypothetical protein